MGSRTTQPDLITSARFKVGIAYVMGSAESSPDAKAVRSFVQERLANCKLRKDIVVLDEMPMLPIGNVDK